ncbi:MAG: hypothetical protein HQ523_08030 [Lentisphaerae bacterium]|nr:hypothetical protein [Lentisphaerota bacterium]
MILAIDLGSTNFKAALFSEALDRVGASSVPAPYLHNDGDHVEMDANDIRQAVVLLFKETCQTAGIRTRDVTTVTVTSQAQNFTFLDGAGRACFPVTSWLDHGAEAEAAALWKTRHTDWHQHCSFGTLTGQMQLAHLLRARTRYPDAFSGGFQMVSLPGLVFHVLAGINLTDDNLAAMGGAYSLRDREWRADVLADCGVTPAHMPRLVPVGHSVRAATHCAQLDLADSLQLVSAGNDQTAGAFGNDCGEGDVLVTLGTALVAYRFAGTAPGPYSDDVCWGPYPDGGYYALATSDKGCQALDWAREQLMPGQDLAHFDAAVETALPSISETTGTFSPALIRTPNAWQGSFADDSEKAYAVLKGITNDLKRLVCQELNCPSGSALRVIGGGSQSNVWLQIIADTFNAPVSAGTGDSLLGAAKMAVGSACLTPARRDLTDQRL